jgi:predicted permease
MIGMGLLVSGIFYYNKISESKKYIALAAFMNANYMVLPIGQLAFPDQFDSFATYTFLFVLGVNPALWSIGKYLITDKADNQFTLKQLFTPPFAAILLAVVLVLTGLHTYIPELIMEPIDFIADAAVPAATLVLGATIGSVSLRKLPPISDILKVTATKLFILPFITIVFLKYTQLLENNSLLADLLVIEAAVAPASSLVIQVRKYGGDSQNVGYIMFITYVLCLLTIPLWFTLWKFIQ